MSQTNGISKGLFAVGLIVAILVSTILSVGIVTQLAAKGPKGDTGATGLQGPIGPQGPAGTSTSGTGTPNQVTVSGSIQEQNPSGISFSSIVGSRQTVVTSGLITNGQYSVVLVGNQSYSVRVTYSTGATESAGYSIYVPSGVSTFTANF